MKRLIISLMSLLLLFSMFTIHTEATTQPIKIFLDGKLLNLDLNPIIENGNTLLELRSVFNELGMDISYDPENKTITMEKDFTLVILTIGNKAVLVNGKPKNKG